MATVEINHDGGVSRTSVLRWVALAALVSVGLILVSHISDVLLRQPSYSAGTPMAQGNLATGHCAQFITVAKAAYGVDWKYRLDPRDTTCAAEVQQQWQSEWNARQPTQPLPTATMTISQPTTAPPVVDPTPAVASRIRNPETYCLNVISLARSRSGADWASHVTPEEAANCGDAIRASGGR